MMSRVNQYSPSQESDEGSMRTDEELAKAAGISRDTIRKAEVLHLWVCIFIGTSVEGRRCNKLQ